MALPPNGTGFFGETVGFKVGGSFINVDAGLVIAGGVAGVVGTRSGSALILPFRR